ncbi:MAG TPA: DUF86 domain-containing protein [Anaerolineae bacterium]
MKRDDSVYLHHILDAIERISNYVQGISRDEFMHTPLIQDGVVRQLEIVGEASRNLSEDLRQGHSNVPWNQIIGLRNRIIHAYFDINLRVVWEIVQNDLVRLHQQIQAILEEMGQSHAG